MCHMPAFETVGMVDGEGHWETIKMIFHEVGVFGKGKIKYKYCS